MRRSLALFVALLFWVAFVHGAVSEVLEGRFAHSAGQNVVLAGAPKTRAECDGSDGAATSVAFFARMSLTLLAESETLYLVSPTHPACLGVGTAWTKMTGDMLTRRCGTTWFTITGVAAGEGEPEVRAGIAVTVAYEDGSYCSTHLTKEEEAAEIVSATWRTWVFACVGVGISSAISLVGILFLICHQNFVRRWLKELLALSCGTFIGSVIFSLLPETALELGLDVKVSAVLLGGIIFGMISETIIHGGVDWLAARRAKREANLLAESGSVSPDDGTGVDVASLSPAASHRNDGMTTFVRIEMQKSLTSLPAAASAADLNQLETPKDIDAVALRPVRVHGAQAPVDERNFMPAFHHETNSTAIDIEQENGPTPAPVVSPIPIAHFAVAEQKDAHSHHMHMHPHVHEDDPHHHHHHHGKKCHARDLTSAHHDMPMHAHSHGSEHGHSHANPVHAALLNTVADGIHNFIDGALIGATFLVNPSVGWTSTIAIALHELPQEVCDFALLTNAGFTPLAAAGVNLLTSFTGFIGAIVAISLGQSFAYEVTNVLPFAAGLFLYLSLGVLLPEMVRVTSTGGWSHHRSVWLAFASGIGVMAVQLALPWGHSHGGQEAEEADAHGGSGHEGHNHG